MRTIAVILAAAAVLLAGCGDDGGDDGGDGGDGGETTRAPAGKTGTGPLSALDADTLCGLVDRATIEKQFNEPISDELSGVNPPEQRGSVVCEYLSQAFVDAETEDLEGKLVVIVKVTPARESTAAKTLDTYMIGGPDDETVAYEPVDGLGEAAGYAGSDLDVGPGGSHLAVIIEVNGDLLEVVTRADPDGTLDQLRPIAEELVEGVKSTLG